ncbi:MAG: threonine--tRNA ligase [Candidatus Falkowbacteria bacterium]
MNIETIRHSLSHVLAQAVLKLYPDAKLAIGPAIDNGFYYDFDLNGKTFSPDDLAKLEKLMKDIVKEKQMFEQYFLSVEDAVKKVDSNEYKKEMIEELAAAGETQISFYKNLNKNGEVVFEDMCRGPHVETTKDVGAFKLQKLAGAYWRGSEKRPMLQRIYGLAFETKEDLANYLKMLEEAEKRDHRIIGKDLFILDPIVGLGLAMWKPKGAMLWRVIEDFWYKEHLKNGYALVRSPHIGSRQLWETSGHWNFFNENMYPTLEVGLSLKEAQTGEIVDKPKEEYLLKPMNCPFHVRTYKSQMWSYRDLPLRWAECGTVYRYEKSGELSGLTRVRGFTQDDAHIICAKAQVEDELKRVIDFILFIYKSFGFDLNTVHVSLSLRDPENKKKYAGNDAGWEFTEKVLRKIAKEKELNFKEELGEAAFYGPKLDFKIKDCLGRLWQCSTLQFDFNLPERFDMTFVNSEGKEERPFMLHRALFGSFERFIGLLIEHYAAAFPIWLAPVQVKVISVGEGHLAKAKEIVETLRQNEIRAEIDDASETVSYKIRKAEKERIPVMLVVGDKEMEKGTVSVRERGVKEQHESSLGDFVENIKEKIKSRE